MFYLTKHSTHFIYGYMVKDHSDSERGNPLQPHGLFFPINCKGSFIYTIPDRIAHTTACCTSRGALAGTRNSSMCPSHKGSIRRPIAPIANALTTEIHLALCFDRRLCHEPFVDYIQ